MKTEELCELTILWHSSDVISENLIHMRMQVVKPRNAAKYLALGLRIYKRVNLKLDKKLESSAIATLSRTQIENCFQVNSFVILSLKRDILRVPRHWASLPLVEARLATYVMLSALICI